MAALKASVERSRAARGESGGADQKPAKKASDHSSTAKKSAKSKAKKSA